MPPRKEDDRLGLLQYAGVASDDPHQHHDDANGARGRQDFHGDAGVRDTGEAVPNPLAPYPQQLAPQGATGATTGGSMYFVPELPDIEVLWARQRPIVTAMLVLSVLGTAWHVLILLAWVFVFGLAGQIAGIVATSMYVCNCGASHVTGPIRSMRAALTASLALTGVSAVLSFYIVVVACVIGDIGLGILSVLHIVGYGIFLYLGVGVWKAATRVIRELPTGMQNIVVNVPRQYELREAAPTTNGIPIAAGVPVRLGQDAA